MAVSKNKRVFCSDLCVLEHLFPSGINEDYEIIADSPNAHLVKDAININGRVTPERLVKLTQDIDALCLSLYETMKKAGFEYESYSAMWAITCAQSFLKYALSIQKGDFTHDVLLTDIQTEKGVRKQPNHYITLFKDHPNLTIKTIQLADLNVTDNYNLIYNKKTNKIVDFVKAFASNVVIYPLTTPMWPILKRVWPLIGKVIGDLKRPGVVLVEESQIIRSICTGLSLKGHSFKFVKDGLTEYRKKYSPNYKEDAGQQYAEIERLIKPLILDFVKQNSQEQAVPATHDELMGRIEKAHFDYYTSYKSAQHFVEEQMDNRKAVLSNMLKNPNEYGFAVACRENNIPIFTFQHGICREISPHFDYITQITESNLAHYFITNTKKAASISKGYAYTKAETIPVGITRDHFAGRNHVENADYPDIFYISTNVYSSNTGFIKSGGDDKMMCDSELFTIKEVLAQANKNILYKTYPTQKYLDTDPCYEEVAKHKNIVLYKEDKDLRYISKYARVLMTCKATSTFNWCFLTDKPVVFLDHPHLAPVRKELIPIFKEMLFYFDLTDENAGAEITKLLNKPIEEIESLYNTEQKRNARESFINEYYYEKDRSAEKRALRIIEEALK